MIKDKIKTIFFLLTVFIISLITYFIISYFLNNEIKKGITQTQISQEEKEILSTDLKNLETFTKSTTLASQEKYIEEVESLLDNKNITKSTENILLFRKALALSIVRSDSKDNRDEAKEIFKKLINIDISRASPGDIFLRDFSIVAATKLELQIKSNVSLIDKNSIVFKEYQYYKKNGYSDQIANLLALNDLTKKISQDRSLDISNKSNAVVIESLLLTQHKEALKKETYDIILSELQNNVKNFFNSKPLTFTDNISTVLEPRIHYAFAFDVSTINTATNISKELNDTIDTTYEYAIQKLTTADNSVDKIAINEMMFFNLVAYMDSMVRRYGDNYDEKQMNTLISRFIEVTKSSKELSDIASSYIKNKDYSQIQSLLELSKKNKSLDDHINYLINTRVQ